MLANGVPATKIQKYYRKKNTWSDTNLSNSNRSGGVVEKGGSKQGS